MGYREFIDSLGIVWKVWNTTPLAGAVLTGEMKNGWLTFESTTFSHRRLAPVPHEWDRLPAEQLEQLCNEAAEVRQATLGVEATVDARIPNEPPHTKEESNPNH